MNSIFDPSDPKVTQNGTEAILKLCQKVRKTPVFDLNTGCFYGCGGRTRTYDLRVMSPTSFQLLYSAIFGTSLMYSWIIAWRKRFVNPFFCRRQKVAAGAANNVRKGGSYPALRF